jgi:ADP-ribose pyrophosphatase YjhB (NUDIX family)
MSDIGRQIEQGSDGPEWANRKVREETDFNIAVQRLTAWIRDYGEKKAPVFMGDLSMVLLAAKENLGLHQEIERLRKSDADKHQLYKIVCDELERMREAVEYLRTNVIQDAGTLENPHAYVWQRIWEEFERRVTSE